MKVLRRNKKNY